MGWGLILKNVNLPRVSLNEIDYKIEQEESLINSIEKRIISLIGYAPKSAEELSDLLIDLESDFESIRESAVNLFLLIYAKEFPENVAEDK